MLMPPPRRIAVVQVGSLYHLLLAVPDWRALRLAFPAAEITLIRPSWADGFPARFPGSLDRFVACPGDPRDAEAALTAPLETFLAEQHAYAYDLAVALDDGNGSGSAVVAIEARLIAGYAVEASQTGFAAHMPYAGDQPECAHYLNLDALLGRRRLDRSPAFPLSAEDRAEADGLMAALPAGGPLVGLHASAGRNPLPEHVAAIGDARSSRYGARIILTGSPAEREVARTVAAAMWTPVVNLSGQTSLGGLAALIERLDLFVSGDRGPVLLAGALGTPTVDVAVPPGRHRPPRRRHLRIVRPRREAFRPQGDVVAWAVEQ